jgi:hypothetical protein
MRARARERRRLHEGGAAADADALACTHALLLQSLQHSSHPH